MQTEKYTNHSGNWNIHPGSYFKSGHNHTMNNSTLRSIRQSIMYDEYRAEEVSQASSSAKESLLVGQERLNELETIAASLLSKITDSTFNSKYGLDYSAPQLIHSYLCTFQPRNFTYVFEAFASVDKIQKDAMKRKKEEIVFHSMFENIIARYTKSRAKPNPVLMETRNSEFCYRLAIVVEAIPVEAQSAMGFNMSILRLLREYEILYYVWEKFRIDLEAMACTPDQLVGIPMPFEFVNIVGTEHDFDYAKTTISFFDIRGSYVPAKATQIPGSNGKSLKSFLSYMSREKVGPSLAYLGELLKSQKRWFSVSTALKVLDQILCRLMVLHRYGVILGNLDLRHLNFGVREAVNVLYVNNFDCALVAPTTHRPLQHFNERYASIGVFRGVSHFVNDIETAFYVFLALLVPRLPWDERDPWAPDFRDGSWAVTSQVKSALKPQIDERQKLWDNTTVLDRLLHSFCINMEGASPVLQGFAFDIIQMVYLKTKEAISSCSGVPHQEFLSNAMTPSTVANNAYTSIRKVIVSFFQFESLSNSLRDPTCQNKVERLLAEESSDARALWDLNNWCWNIFETIFLQGRSRNSSKRSVRF